jgi:hypothetical protein
MSSPAADALDLVSPPLSAPVEAWLVEGGDDRITLDPETGLNRYGCGLSPDDSLSGFGSSTASTISRFGLTAAEARRAQFEGYGSKEAAWIAGSGDLKARLAGLCGVPQDKAERIVLAASGTDICQVAADLARADAPAGLTVILPEPAETGRGVPGALAPEGGLLAVPLREADGRPRSVEAIDAEVEARVGEALAPADARVLLCLFDVSKTGLLAPSPACAERLKARFGERLMVFVDACQFRVGPETVAAYLAREFVVALTGSKFLGGPAFSGALILPDSAGAVSRVPEPPSLGVLLRWEAAVSELAVFRRQDQAAVAALIRRFGEAAACAIEASPNLERVHALPLRRFGESGWDTLPTIFSFLPVRDGQALPADETQALFARLQGTKLGQPAPVGVRGGRPVSVLRLSLSARQISAALARPRGGEVLIEHALATLERTARQIAA